MKTIQLNNGIEIPQIGLGVFRMDDSKDTINLVKKALEVGYKSIDTATIYGNEESVGIAIKESGIKREELFITTKLWNEDMRENNALKAFELSLKKLQLDYIDLYLIHWPVKEKYVQSYQVLERIYKEGRVKSIGVSNFHIHHLEELMAHTQIIPVVNQIEIHPYLNQNEIINFCKKHSIAVEAWSPLGAGLNDLLTQPILNKIAQEHEKSTAQIILKWHLQRNVIVIPKASSEARLKENLNLFDFELSNTQMDEINNLNKNLRIGPDPDNFNF